MSIILPNELPAARTLRDEGVEVRSGDAVRGGRGDRPLRIALLNLMPLKPATETQIARLLGGTPLPVELTLLIPGSYTPTTTAAAHIDAFYARWPQVRDCRFDGLVVTGAPVETLPFEAVAYWHELRDLFDWTQSHAGGLLTLCWAAQAALYHFHGVPKHALPAKLSGVYRQRVAAPASPLLRGFGESFVAPVSRHTEVRAADLPRDRDLEVLADSLESGLCLIEDRPHNAVCMFNHLEYDADTLRQEFLRDRGRGEPVAPPRHYFPEDDPDRAPANVWRPYGHLLFENWLGLIERRRESRREDWFMPWLVGQPAGPGDDLPYLLVATRAGAAAVSDLLHALAGLGIAPRSGRTHRSSGGSDLLEFRIEPLPETTAEDILKKLLRSPEIQGVAYRGSKGSTGMLVVDREPRHGGAAGDLRVSPRSTAAA